MNQQQNIRRARLALLAILLLVIIEFWLHQRVKRLTQNPAPAPPPIAEATAPTTASNPPPIVSNLVATPPTNSPPVAANPLQNLFDAVKESPDAKTARQHLAELRAALAAMPTNAAVAVVRQFLDSKADAPTHLGFKVAANGLLDDAPTLRTFLLDELGRLDPAAAADYSRVILAAKDSPDEWAIALRNLANGDSTSDGRTLLQQKAGELLQYEPWQQNPTTGYLESFDVAVYLGGTSLMPTLSDLVRKQDNPGIAHAAYLALDRLVISSPTAALTALDADPDLMQGRELTRANYFARADVRDPQQRQVLENYLLNPSIGPAELDTFAGVYPNANYMISANLLTPTPTPDRASLTSRDAESLAVAQQWLADPRFANLTPVLQKMTARLQTFVQQANQPH